MCVWWGVGGGEGAMGGGEGLKKTSSQSEQW